MTSSTAAIVSYDDMQAEIAAMSRVLDFAERLFGAAVRCRLCAGEGVVFACRAGLSDEADICPDCGGEGSVTA